MRVLLVQPGYNPKYIGFKNVNRLESLALETIASPLHHLVKFLDMRLEQDTALEKTLREFEPDVLGVTSFTTDVYIAIDIMRRAKDHNPDILTVVGGMHATVMPESFFQPWVDVVVIGEGDFSFSELVDAYENGGKFGDVRGIAFRKGDQFAFTNERELIDDLDKIPMPAIDIAKKYSRRYHYASMYPCRSIETARGCLHRCKFCSVWKVHRGRYRRKSVERVLDEIEGTRGRYIIFVDDNFLQDAARAERIYEGIKDRGIEKIYGFQARTDTIAKNPDLVEKWADIGLAGLLVGFESIKQEELDQLNKGTSIQDNEKAIKVMRDCGVVNWAAFVVNPDYEKNDFDGLIKYIKEKEIDFLQLTTLTPLPGTDYFDEMRGELKTLNWECYDYLHLVLPAKLPEIEFYENFARVNRKTWFNLKRWIRLGRHVSKAPPSFILFPKVFKLLRSTLRVSNPRTYLK